jgi:hypothetical protein
MLALVDPEYGGNIYLKETLANLYQITQSYISKVIIIQEYQNFGLLYAKIYQDDDVKEDEMGGACSKHERNRNWV